VHAGAWVCATVCVIVLGIVVMPIAVTVRLCSDLAGLQYFPSLDTLILDKNNLDGLLNCPDIPTLRTLWFNNNAMTDLPGFMDAVTSKFPKLEYLSVMRNPACSGVSSLRPDMEAVRLYRLYIIYRMPTLKTVDWSDVTEEVRHSWRPCSVYYCS
jgi:hypothetical protein